MSTSTNQQELLNTQLNANEADNLNSGNELIDRVEIKGTPFTITGRKETGYLLVFGRYKFTEEMETIDAVHEYLKDNYMTVILQLAIAVCETHDRLKEDLKKLIP